MTLLSYESPFTDDPGIPAEEILYRRVPVQWIDWDAEQNGPRIKRAAFQDYPAERAADLNLPGPCMSVGLSSILDEHGVDPADLLTDWGRESYGLASVRAADVRLNNDQGIMPWPTQAEPWHGVVFSKKGPKRTGSMQSQLARAAVWVVLPDRPEV